jgi:DNA-binding transcriptional ArsR family regulator
VSDSLLISGPFVAYLPALGRLLGNVESAIILQHLHFRAQVSEDGLARVSQQDVADETGMALRTVERRLRALRDRGLVSAERSSTWDATLAYRVHPARLAEWMSESSKVAD